MRCSCAVLLLGWLVGCAGIAQAQTCTTQSQMSSSERASLVQAGTELATLTAAGDAAGVRARTMQPYAQDFTGIQDAIRSAAPHLQGASFVPESLWILDASAAKPGSDGKPQDVEFLCTLNRGTRETTFSIPALPAGRYALTVLNTVGVAEPWQLALLLRQSGPGTWQLGGLFPHATVAGGHDGLWYWRTARELAAKRQAWNAYVYYSEAEQLLRPVAFMSSTNLDMLQAERAKAAPPALSGGLGPNQPLVLAAAQGDEVRVTDLRAENAPDHSGSLDLLVHVQVSGPLADPIASRARNAHAAKTLIAAFPELRSTFHGVWIVADLPGGGTYISEEPMTSL